MGVDVNTASSALLTRVSGLSATVAENIVAHRDANGAFKSRKALLKVPRLGDKTFEPVSYTHLDVYKRQAVGLLDEGATVPFIARYRKEVTGGLDDTQLRNLETRLTYLREMEDLSLIHI